jgi:membrane-associated phospholipid phosphatase
VFLWGYAALWFNRKKANRRLLWFVAVYTVAVAWSRMYAGVHYPQDVIAGLILGLMMLYIYWRYTKPVPQVTAES